MLTHASAFWIAAFAFHLQELSLCSYPGAACVGTWAALCCGYTLSLQAVLHRTRRSLKISHSSGAVVTYFLAWRKVVSSKTKPK